MSEAPSGGPRPFDAAGPHTRALVEAVAAHWPDHLGYLAKSFAPRSPALMNTTERVAEFIAGITPFPGCVSDYRFMCETLFAPEELHFARTGEYRLKTFSEAAKEVYENHAVMGRYMLGLLASYVLWIHHAQAIDHFQSDYLRSMTQGGRHLEVGPGHGLLLHLSVASGAFDEVVGWDISEASIEHTRRALRTFGQESKVHLRKADIFRLESESAGRFDSIVLSEILEHLEEPGRALEIVRGLLKPGGLLWVNVPLNAPAPDHIYLLRSPEEARGLISGAGFTIARAEAFPLAGATLERALRQALPVSCVLVARRSD